MFSNSRRTLVVALAVAATTTIAVAMGAGSIRSSRQAVLGPERGQFLFSATEIIRLPGGVERFDSDIARLDTRSGAIYRFRGSTRNSSTRNSWELRVEGVRRDAGGLFEVQIVQDPITHDARATFLVDLVNGDTWILRPRNNTNATWDPVGIFGPSRQH